MPRNRANRRRADSSATAAGTSSAALPPRSKAGCWTCRIRRKRCDEIQDDNGSCQACNRLNIECLGWGTRRPDWCRDKDRLAQYKLDLKRKLCSRAGTRPSANKSAGNTSSTSAAPVRAEYNDNVKRRAPSGESPHTGSDSSVDEDGDEDLETDDYTTTPFTPLSALPTDSPLLFTPNSPFAQQPLAMQFPTYPKYKSTPLLTISQKLRHLLVNARVPAGYANILSQLLDLYALKANALSEQEIARRAQAIEVELNKLSHRQSFDDLLSSALGFNFDPTSFLSAQSNNNGFGMDAQFSSPMTMWSPDLMSDGMSTFSGSSAPTSPAAPLLGMTSNFNNDFLGFDVQQQQTYDSSSFGTFQSFSSPVQQPMTALGLTNDFLFPEASSFGPAPTISLFPPTRSGSLNVDLMPAKSSPAPAVPAPSVAAATSHDASDPFQIHHETCSLLLQAVLNSEESHPYFEMSNLPSYGLESLALEESMQRLIGKFQSIQGGGQGLAVEYVFSATLAGALSTSQNRRAFFLNIVKGIERTSGIVGSSLLGEAWA